MHICIDSCVFIRGLQTQATDVQQIFDAVGIKLTLVIPRLVAKEVTRNLADVSSVRRFYYLFVHHQAVATIIDQPPPDYLVKRYVALGLPAKADAFIGAFAEWQHVDYLISDNRHFLRLQPTSFHILSALEFGARFL